MASLQEACRPQQCPRCGGRVYEDYDRDYTCLSCGECVYYVAPRVRWQDLEPPLEPGKRKRGRPRKNPVAA